VSSWSLTLTVTWLPEIVNRTVVVPLLGPSGLSPDVYLTDLANFPCAIGAFR
jgi:hypothetical protein